MGRVVRPLLLAHPDQPVVLWPVNMSQGIPALASSASRAAIEPHLPRSGGLIARISSA